MHNDNSLRLARRRQLLGAELACQIATRRLHSTLVVSRALREANHNNNIRRVDVHVDDVVVVAVVDFLW